MTTNERLSMVKSAMDTIRNDKKLDQKAKQRGLKSLKKAYEKYAKMAPTKRHR